MRRKANADDLYSTRESNDFSDDHLKRRKRKKWQTVVVILSACLIVFYVIEKLRYKFAIEQPQNKMEVREIKNDDSFLPRSDLKQEENRGAASKTAQMKGCVSVLPDEYLQKPHIVKPPNGPVSLVCCNTTVGILNVAVHSNWAPIGAARFLDMVKEDFFSSRVALFRALKGFIVQFGLAGTPQVQHNFDSKGELPDDPSWLPLGPAGGEKEGVKRFQRGYLSFAGAGPNTRGTQMFITFEDDDWLGGESPWEVPFGRLVDEESYKSLSKIYTGYGESPEQSEIMDRGNEYLQNEFPLLDYIESCAIVKENIASI